MNFEKSKKKFKMDIVNKHEVHEKSYRKLAAEYGVSGKWLIFENLIFFRNFYLMTVT